jgi:hypothetical protein
MAELRDQWDREAKRLQNALESGRPNLIALSRARFQRKHRAYWEAVHQTWADIQNNTGTPPQEIADANGVLLEDVAEIAGV